MDLCQPKQVKLYNTVLVVNNSFINKPSIHGWSLYVVDRVQLSHSAVDVYNDNM